MACVHKTNSAQHESDFERCLQQACSISSIDFVVPVDWQSAAESIVRMRPHYFAIGPHQASYSKTIEIGIQEEEAVKLTGTKIRTFFARGKQVQENSKHAAKTKSERFQFFEKLSEKFSVEQVLTYLESLRELRVAVVGETIIDEYAYCDALGKSGKEPMLVTRFISCDVQAGGVLAIANHLAEFSDQVVLVSALGPEKDRQQYVHSAIRPEIEAHFVHQQNSPTIVKRRYTDAYSLAKMFGVYNIGQEELSKSEEFEFTRTLSQIVPQCDLVIVADYGHGLITRRAVELLTEKSKFLAVNTQLNAANAGYHTLSKYSAADFACLHQGELRLDARDLRSDLQPLIRRTSRRLDMPKMMITLGKSGTVLYQKGGFTHCPAMASSVVERVGAGDAVLALASLACAKGLRPELISLFSNLAGAQAVSVLGNSASIKKERMIESIRLMMNASADRRINMHRQNHATRSSVF